MKKCKKCNQDINDKFKYCPHCGVNLEGEKIAPETEDAFKMIKNLFDVARGLSSTFDVDVLLKKIGDAAERLTNSQANSIMLLDEDKKNLYFKVASGEKSYAIKKMLVSVGKGIAGNVAQTRKPMIVNDVKKSELFSADFDKSTGFVTKSILCVPMIYADVLIGVIEVLNKENPVGTSQEYTESDLELLLDLASLAAVSIYNAKLVETQKNFFTHIIEILISGIESSNPKMRGHSVRVAQTACFVAKQLEITGDEYKTIYYAGLLHDIGSLGFGNETFIKRISASYHIIDYERVHPVLGAEMVKNIELLKDVAPVIRAHHEKIDGSGYPDGLKGDEIPLGAKIISILEDLEEITMQGYEDEELFSRQIELLKKFSGIKYDENIARIIQDYISEKAALSV